MKNKTIMFVITNIFLSIFLGLLSLTIDNSLFATLARYISLTFTTFSFILLLNIIYKQLLKKDNSKKLLIISTLLYFIFSILYNIISYYMIGSNILQTSIMIIFYISLLFLLLTYCSVYYFWISKKNIKYIIRTLIILLLIIALCLIFNLIYNHIEISSIVILIVNYTYISMVLLLSAILITYIFRKLVLPIDKR